MLFVQLNYQIFKLIKAKCQKIILNQSKVNIKHSQIYFALLIKLDLK